MTATCDWCGRAIRPDDSNRWWAVKGTERGYDPAVCDANPDGLHEPAGRAEGTPCRVCGEPLSDARAALGLTICSGACHRAAGQPLSNRLIDAAREDSDG